MAARRWPAGLAGFIFLWAANLGSCEDPVGRAEDRVKLGREPVVRIGIKVGVSQSLLSCDGAVRLWRRGTGLLSSRLGPPVSLRLLPSRISHQVWEASSGLCPTPGWGVSVGEVRRGQLGVFPEELVFEPISPGEPIRVDGKPYRGEVVVRVSDNEALTIINAVHVEDYLRGVVPAEMGSAPDLPDAALRAQAIAARSYALFYLDRYKDLGFDLYGGPQDQVYGGIQVETEAATRAVLATRGIVAVHNDKPIRANYHSTCGGATEASGRIWPGEAFPYLHPARDRASGGGVLCSKSPRFRWRESWPCEELHRMVLRHLPEEVPEAAQDRPTRVKDLHVKQRSRSGRAEVLEVRTDTGRYQIRGDRIRWVLRRPGDRPLWSTLFGELKRTRRSGCTVTLEGAGHGHGAGMCQIGAIELARRGRSTPQILKHYFRGIDFARWW